MNKTSVNFKVKPGSIVLIEYKVNWFTKLLNGILNEYTVSMPLMNTLPNYNYGLVSIDLKGIKNIKIFKPKKEYSSTEITKVTAIQNTGCTSIEDIVGVVNAIRPNTFTVDMFIKDLLKSKYYKETSIVKYYDKEKYTSIGIYSVE